MGKKRNHSENENEKMLFKKKLMEKPLNDYKKRMASGKDLLMKKFENVSVLGTDMKQEVEPQGTKQDTVKRRDETGVSSSLYQKKEKKGEEFGKEFKTKLTDSMKKKTQKRKIDEGQNKSPVKSEKTQKSDASKNGQEGAGNVKKIKKSKSEPAVTFSSDDANRNDACNQEDNKDTNEDEEDEEKKEIRRKKREHRKLKKEAKEKLKQENTERAGSACGAAIEYLRQWDNNRSEWKFMKVRQVWLLQNMFDSNLVQDDVFEVLLRYLEALKGHSREKTVASAEKVMEADTSDQDYEVTKLDRARQVIQLLS